jgi:hypothetical protein
MKTIFEYKKLPVKRAAALAFKPSPLSNSTPIWQSIADGLDKADAHLSSLRAKYDITIGKFRVRPWEEYAAEKALRDVKEKYANHWRWAIKRKAEQAYDDLSKPENRGRDWSELLGTLGQAVALAHAHKEIMTEVGDEFCTARETIDAQYRSELADEQFKILERWIEQHPLKRTAA